MPPADRPAWTSLLRTLRHRDRLRAGDVSRLARALEGRRLDRRHADALFALNDAVAAADNDPAWHDLFVRTITRIVLGRRGRLHELSGRDAEYLIARIDADGQVTDEELDLLVNVCMLARQAPPVYHEYVLRAVRNAVLADGTIDEGEVDLIRRVIRAPGSPGAEGVDRRGADFLFALNDTAGKRAAASWRSLFTQAVSEAVLADEDSPGEIDASEARWLADHMRADGQLDEAEQAVLETVRHHVRARQVWGGVQGADVQATTDALQASLYARPCGGGKGGDIYYFSASEGDLVTRIALIDVMGHGPAVSDISQWVYRSLARRINSVDSHQILADLNEPMAAKGYRAMATAVVVSYSRAETCLRFSYAGHPPLLVSRRAGSRWHAAQLHAAPGPSNLPLGVMPDVTYDQQALDVATGDQWFLYTDGVLEAPGADKDLFGSDRLRATLDRAGHGDVHAVKDAVLAALIDHAGQPFSHDDVTFLAVEVR